MYEFNLTLKQPFDQAMETVREALMGQHLGVVSEVNVQAILKNKMDKEVPPYRIFGACNPGLADRVITAEPNAGTLLPCNFVMRAVSDDETVVSFMDPVSVLALSESGEVRKVAEEARAILDRVMETLNNV